MGGTNQCNHIQVPYNPNPGKSLGGKNNAPNETLPEIECERQQKPSRKLSLRHRGVLFLIAQPNIKLTFRARRHGKGIQNLQNKLRLVSASLPATLQQNLKAYHYCGQKYPESHPNCSSPQFPNTHPHNYNNRPHLFETILAAILSLATSSPASRN